MRAGFKPKEKILLLFVVPTENGKEYLVMATDKEAAYRLVAKRKGRINEIAITLYESIVEIPIPTQPQILYTFEKKERKRDE
jgi:hypothetical protein